MKNHFIRGKFMPIVLVIMAILCPNFLQAGFEGKYHEKDSSYLGKEGQRYEFTRGHCFHVSPVRQTDLDEDWVPLTRSLLRRLGKDIWDRLSDRGHRGHALSSLFWSEIGAIFEIAVLESLEITSNTDNFNGTVPDAVGRIINGKIWQGWPKAVFIEVKVSTLIPIRDRDRIQLLRMIAYLQEVTERADVTPALILVTPAGGFIESEIVDAATRAKVSLLHAEVQANSLNNKVIRVGPAKPVNNLIEGVPLMRILRGKYGHPAGLNI